jgi:hypothetical protein
MANGASSRDRKNMGSVAPDLTPVQSDANESPDLSVYGGTLFPLPLKQREEKAGAAEAGGAGGHREGRMSWREDVPIWAEGVLYLEITSLLFWVKFEMGTAKPF